MLSVTIGSDFLPRFDLHICNSKPSNHVVMLSFIWVSQKSSIALALQEEMFLSIAWVCTQRSLMQNNLKKFCYRIYLYMFPGVFLQLIWLNISNNLQHKSQDHMSLCSYYFSGMVCLLGGALFHVILVGLTITWPCFSTTGMIICPQIHVCVYCSPSD